MLDDNSRDQSAPPAGNSSDGGWPAAGSSGAPKDAEPRLIDRLQAARMLGVSPGTIDNLRKRGELPSLKIGSRRLYDIADLYAFISSRKEVSDAD